MKVLHILYSGLGGHGSVFFSMLKADCDHAFEFQALFNGIEDIRQEYVDRCNANNIPFTYIKKLPGKHMGFNWRLFRAIIKAKPHVIFLHGSMAIPAAFAAKVLSLRKTRIVIRETQSMHLKTKLDNMALQLGMRFADNVVFLSEEYRQQAEKKLGSFYQPKKVAVIPNGIDLSFFCPIPRRPASNIVLLGMQSRLVAIKDHETLFRALVILKGLHPGVIYKLQIAGDGEYRDKLEQMVEAAGLQSVVIFKGMLDESELPAFLQSLDIYIHASLGETMSTAIMQAMACGLPIIASDVSGINNMIVHGQNGILVPVKKAETMARAIMNLAVDTVLQDNLSREALRYAAVNFSNKRMLENYKRLFL